jgi:hypothetical protein
MTKKLNNYQFYGVDIKENKSVINHFNWLSVEECKDILINCPC